MSQINLDELNTSTANKKRKIQKSKSYEYYKKLQKFLNENYRDKDDEIVNYKDLINSIKDLKNKDKFIERVKEDLEVNYSVKTEEVPIKILEELIREVLHKNKSSATGSNLPKNKYSDEIMDIINFFKEQKKFSKIKEEQIVSDDPIEDIIESFKDLIENAPVGVYKTIFTSNTDTYKKLYKIYNQPDIVIVFVPNEDDYSEKIKEEMKKYLQSKNIPFEEIEIIEDQGN